MSSKAKNTWQSYSIGTSNLTDKQVDQVVEELSKAVEKIKALGIDVETSVETDSGEF